MKTLTKIVFALLLFTSTKLIGQEVDIDTLELKDFYVDLSIPDNGITNLIDVNFTQVQSLNNFKDFAIQVVNGQGEDEAQGFGAEFSLGRLLVPKQSQTVMNYRRKGSGFRFLTNVRPLLGYSNSNNGLNLAAGLNVKLFNKADPLLTKWYYEESESALSTFFSVEQQAELRNKSNVSIRAISALVFKDSVNGDSLKTEIRRKAIDIYSVDVKTDKDDFGQKIRIFKQSLYGYGIEVNSLNQLLNTLDSWEATLINRLDKLKSWEKELGQRIKGLNDKFKANTWNAHFVTLNSGILWNASDGRFSNVSPTKWQLSAATGFRFYEQNRRSQLLITLRFSGNIAGASLVPTSSDEVADEPREQNNYFGGSRFIYKLNTGSTLTTNLFLEAGLTRKTYFNQDLEDDWRGVIGFETQILKNFWIQTGIAFEDNESIFQIDFKQAFNKKSRF